MFEKNPKNSSYVMFGVECGRGWYNLLETLLTKLAVLDTAKIIRITQIKEKFGTLRFYIDFAESKQEDTYYEYIYDMITKYEQISSVTCEHCGQPGKARKGGWIKTLCNECDDLNKKAKQSEVEDLIASGHLQAGDL